MNYGQNISHTVVAAAAFAQYVGVTAAGAIAAAGVDFHGVCQDKPQIGDFFAATTFGETKVLCGSGGLAAGDKVSVVGSGFFTKVVSGGYFVGRCIFAAGSGGYANANIFPPSYWNGV
jgi:hypothetical protein